jgi:anhydro-N-acetylmuramic acid kinase
MTDLQQLAEKQERLIVGTMSGTSTDGYDIALTRISGSRETMRVHLLASASIPLPAELTTELFGVYPPNRVTPRHLA